MRIPHTRTLGKVCDSSHSASHNCQNLPTCFDPGWSIGIYMYILYIISFPKRKCMEKMMPRALPRLGDVKIFKVTWLPSIRCNFVPLASNDLPQRSAHRCKAAPHTCTNVQRWEAEMAKLFRHQGACAKPSCKHFGTAPRNFFKLAISRKKSFGICNFRP